MRPSDGSTFWKILFFKKKKTRPDTRPTDATSVGRSPYQGLSLISDHSKNANFVDSDKHGTTDPRTDLRTGGLTLL